MKKVFAAILAIMVLTTCAWATFSDMPPEKSWSYDALSFAIENKLLTGTSAGQIDPNGKLTRVQLAAIMNRIFGATKEADLSGYSDLTDSWTSTQLAIAAQMGIMTGYGDHTMRPYAYVTREQAFAVVGRAILLTKSSGAAAAIEANFSDGDQVGEWAQNTIGAMVKAGYIHGNNGKLEPKSEITRAQFAQLIYNIFTKMVSSTDTFTNNGSVVLRTGDVTLKDCIIRGDLIIADGVGEQDVILDGVTVTGRLIVRGGASDTVQVINNSAVSGGISVCKTTGAVRIDWESALKSSVPDVSVMGGSQTVVLSGSYGTVSLMDDGLTVEARKAGIQTGVILGDNSRIIVDESSSLGYARIAAEQTKSSIVVTDSTGKTTTITGKESAEVTYTPTTTASSGGGSSTPTLTAAVIPGLQFDLTYDRGGTSQVMAAAADTSGTLLSTIDLTTLQTTDHILSGKITTTNTGITLTYHQYYNSAVTFHAGTDYTLAQFLSSFSKIGPAATVQAVSNYITTIKTLGYHGANEFASLNSDGSIVILGYLTADNYAGSVPYNIKIVPLS